MGEPWMAFTPTQWRFIRERKLAEWESVPLKFDYRGYRVARVGSGVPERFAWVAIYLGPPEEAIRDGLALEYAGFNKDEILAMIDAGQRPGTPGEGSASAR